MSLGAPGSALVKNGRTTWDPPLENTPIYRSFRIHCPQNMFILAIPVNPTLQISDRTARPSRRPSFVWLRVALPPSLLLLESPPPPS
jgi:hypothetical protein